jgi:GxxExxY protein
MREKVERDRINEITQGIIEAGIEVHRILGPGLLESIYEDCLAMELGVRGFRVERQKKLPVMYKGKQAGRPFRLDFLVENEVVVELKTVGTILPLHQAQLLTYLKLTGCSVGLILNFNSPLIKDGIRRIVNEFDK